MRSSPAVWDGHFCVGSYDTKIYCFADKSAKKEFEEDIDTVLDRVINKPEKVLWSKLFIPSISEFKFFDDFTLIQIQSNTFWNLYQCLSNKTGEVIWMKTLRNDRSEWNKLYWENSFFITRYDGDGSKIVVSIDIETGKEKWRCKLSDYSYESYRVYLLDNRLFLRVDGEVVVLNPENGNEDEDIFTLPELLPYYLDENVILYFLDQSFYGYDRDSGEELFRFKPAWNPEYLALAKSLKQKPNFVKLHERKLVVISTGRYSAKMVAVFDIDTGKIAYYGENIICFMNNGDEIVFLADIGDKLTSVQLLELDGSGVKWFY